MKQLAEELPSMPDIAKQQESVTKTLAVGSGTANGNAITQFQPKRRPDMAEVPKILSQLRSILPLQTKRTSPEVAISILAYATIPATYQEAAHWITRLLAHYPRIEAAKAGVILSDLSGEVLKQGISLVAVHAVCDETWKESTSENPWMIPTGELLENMARRSEFYRKTMEGLLNPAPLLGQGSSVVSSAEEKVRMWPDLSQDERSELLFKISLMNPKLKDIFVRSYDIPDEEFEPVLASTAEQKPN